MSAAFSSRNPGEVSNKEFLLVGTLFVLAVTFIGFFYCYLRTSVTTGNYDAAVTATHQLSQQGTYGKFLSSQITDCAKSDFHLPRDPQGVVQWCSQDVLTQIGLRQGKDGLTKAQAMFAKAGLN